MTTKDRRTVSEYDVMEEILADWDSEIEEGEAGVLPPFQQAFEDYYWNLHDDLHDSKGDPDHQRGLLERIAACNAIVQGLRSIDLQEANPEDISEELQGEQ